MQGGQKIPIRIFGAVQWEFDLPYSLNLEQNDFHLFTRIKVYLGTQQFKDNVELMNRELAEISIWRHPTLMMAYKTCLIDTSDGDCRKIAYINNANNFYV